MKKLKSLICLMLVALLLAVCTPAVSAIDAAPETKANNVMVISMNTGATIYEKNADQQIYPASVTKLMTMKVAIDLITDVQATITFDKQAAYGDLVIGSSNMGLKDGEVISIENMLYGIAISSANEATNALAIHLCGSIQAFVDKMNQQAKEWGMNNTHFVNTHGLTDENHYTTARDIGIMSQKVFSDERLLPYLTASSYKLPATNMNPERTLISTNQLIRMNSGNYYKYCVAGKTGTTSAAGYNLVSNAKYKGMEYICVAMNAPYGSATNPIFEDSIALYKWAYNNFSMRTLLNENEPICEMEVALCAKNDYVMLVPKEQVKAVVANDVDLETFEWEITKNKDEDGKEIAYAPVVTGDVLGSVSVTKDGITYGTVDLVASSDLERSAILYYLHLIRNFFDHLVVRIVAIILVVLIILYIIYMIYQNNNRRRRRLARRIRF